MPSKTHASPGKNDTTPVDYPPFSLNGFTLLRFVRGYASGAGLEYDVAMINQALCERYDLHIIQIHMARPGDELTPHEKSVGRGRVTSIPLLRDVLPVRGAEHSPWGFAALAGRCKRGLRDHLLFNPLTGSWLARQVAACSSRTKPGDVPGVGSKVREILRNRQVGMLMVHAAGGSDAEEAIHEARQAGVPSAIQLHFANERFKDLSVRLQVGEVDGVGGVSDVRIPAYLSKRFINLLTAVDLKFFSRNHAAAFPQKFKRPVLVLPARIVPTKGHDDLVEAGKLLRNWGMGVDIVFAGRADQPEYEQALRNKITAAGLADSFHFLGLLNPEQLRDLYPVCTVLAFPTYHQEGLPRILLEAQAMEVPVVVYDSGGSKAGMVPDKTGFLVKPGETVAFAQAIRRLLQDPGLAKSFAHAGRVFVETHFGLSALADRHESFIASTLLNTKTRRA